MFSLSLIDVLACAKECAIVVYIFCCVVIQTLTNALQKRTCVTMVTAIISEEATRVAVTKATPDACVKPVNIFRTVPVFVFVFFFLLRTFRVFSDFHRFEIF